MTKLDDEVDSIAYTQSQSIVQAKSLPELLRFAADVIRDRSDPYNKALAEELVKRAEPTGHGDDWTIDPATNRSNSSAEFNRLCDEVERLIRGDAHMLISGQAGRTAGLIMAQLAHKHGLVPRHLLEKK